MPVVPRMALRGASQITAKLIRRTVRATCLSEALGGSRVGTSAPVHSAGNLACGAYRVGGLLRPCQKTVRIPDETHDPD